MAFKFEKLRVWHISMYFGEQIFYLSLTFPDHEKLIAFTKSNKEFEGENIYDYTIGAKIIFDVGKNYSETKFSTPIYFINGKREEM